MINISIMLVFSISACKQDYSQKNNFRVSTYSLLDEIIERGELWVGTTGDFTPFSYQDDKNSSEYKGVDIEMAKDLASVLGVQLRLVKTSWPSLIKDLEDKKYDLCMSGVTIKLDRQTKGLFSIPILQSGKAVITRDENASKFNSIESINNTTVKVIVNPGGTNEQFALQNFPNAEIIKNEDNLSIFQRIVDGDADLMVTDAVETMVQEKIHPELEAVNADNPFNFFEMGYLLQRDFVFKAYIDQWINLRIKEGSYQKLFDAELEKFVEKQ